MKRINSVIVAFVWFCSIVLVGCQNEDTPMPTVEPEDGSISQLLSNRTPQEAIDIATEAYAAMFNGDESELKSRAGSGLLVPTVSVIPSKHAARSLATQNDTCLYVVNFPEESGFAIIAANRSVDAVLGISDSGNYYLDTDNDNPGLDQFVEQAISYVATESGSLVKDTAIWIGNDDKLTVKEYDDTTVYTDIKPRVKNAWGPGDGSSTFDNPTGAKFSNKYCGDGVIAIAHTMLYFQYPDTIKGSHNLETNNGTAAIPVDWKSLKSHAKIVNYNDNFVLEGSYCGATSHAHIANVCRAIGNFASATEYTMDPTPFTTIDMDGFSNAIVSLGLRVQGWQSMNINVTLSETPSIIAMYGLANDDSGRPAYFIIDGEKDYKIEHHYQTSNMKTVTDVITSTKTYNLYHINWGHGGKGNGWYTKGVYSPSNMSNTTYIMNNYTTITRK
jgi:hypothetical protein